MVKIVNLRVCVNCGKKHNYPWRRKFCSEKCFYEHNKKTTKVNKECLYCKKTFLGNKNGKYCCSDCKYKHSYILPKPPPDLNNKLIKLRFEILKRDGFKCQYCGRNPKEDNCKLHIDHINPKSNGGLNNPDNLITSCFECNIGKSDVLLEYRLLKNNN